MQPLLADFKESFVLLVQMHTLLNYPVYHLGNVFWLLKNPFVGEKSPPSLLVVNVRSKAQ